MIGSETGNENGVPVLSNTVKPRKGVGEEGDSYRQLRTLTLFSPRSCQSCPTERQEKVSINLPCGPRLS